MTLDLTSDSAAFAENSEFEVLVICGVGHIGAGQQHVAAADDRFRVELGVEGFATINGRSLVGGNGSTDTCCTCGMSRRIHGLSDSHWSEPPCLEDEPGFSSECRAPQEN